MNKIIMYFISLSMLVFFLAGCQQAQEGIPKDISYVSIDKISANDTIDNIPEVPLLTQDTSDATDDETVVEANETAEEIKVVAEEEEDAADEEKEAEEEEKTTPVAPEKPKETVIVVKETELVSLKPVAKDPDQDNLKFTYSTPLNDKGQWQTTYGDAGQYTVTITASDGELTSSKDALLIVNKKEEAPTIDTHLPEDLAQKIKENIKVEFKIKASDLNKDPLTYTWKLDGEDVSSTDSYNYFADYSSAGSHTIKLDVFDGTTTTSLIWSVTVENVDRAPVLKPISDVTIKETETVTIKPDAADPDGDEIKYTISPPIGDAGVWNTDYSSAGVYTVNVTASDGELEDTQAVKVTVINVNRAPVIDDIVQVQ